MRRLRWAGLLALLPLLIMSACGQGSTTHDFPSGDEAPSGYATPTPRPDEPLAPLHGVLAPRPAPELVVRSSSLISPLTGRGSPSLTAERWNVAGTDLGITFEMNGKTYIIFGDTWGRDGVEGADWRSNVMGVIDPANGHTITEMVTGPDGQAKELLSSLKEPEVEYTVAPTSAIAVGQRMYMHYVSINDWQEQWWAYKIPVINGSGFAYSDDYGHTWVRDEVAKWEGETAFTHVAMEKKDGYIYVFGTGALRFGPARLYRVPEDRLIEPQHYEYWAGDRWSKDPFSVTDVVPAPVGEMSVRWSQFHNRWLMMYVNELTHAIVLRTAERPEGPWSDEQTVVTDQEHPSLYAPIMLPVTGPDIYFAMSIFYGNYNVMLMRLTLTPAGVASVSEEG